MSVAAVINVHLGLGEARSLVYESAVRAAAIAENAGRGKVVAHERNALHRALDDAQAQLPPGDPCRDLLDLVRALHPRIHARTGRAPAWGRSRVWPLLAAAWSEAHPASVFPLKRKSSFTLLVDSVHEELGVALPDGSTLARAATDLSKGVGGLEGLDGLSFWTRIAPVYAQLAAIYES